MKIILLIASAILLSACEPVTVTTGNSVPATDLENFFRKHKIDNNYAVALKKRSAGDSYLATIHGYPNNLSVCQALIEPYNKNPEMSVVPGNYFCEELH